MVETTAVFLQPHSPHPQAMSSFLLEVLLLPGGQAMAPMRSQKLQCFAPCTGKCRATHMPLASTVWLERECPWTGFVTLFLQTCLKESDGSDTEDFCSDHSEDCLSEASWEPVDKKETEVCVL